MENKNKYKDFLVRDFICDEYFQDWVLRGEKENNEFWNQWLIQHPQKKETVATAKELLLNLDFKVNRPVGEKAKESLERTLAIIDESETYERPARIIGFSRVWKAAAIFILVAGIGALVYFLNPAERTNEIATAYGKIDTLVLPDQSTIVLNANSSIRYNKNWDKNTTREVWLKGEAFFNINHLDTDKKIEAHERFLVHIEDATIEVLGTSFNVRERRGKAEVVLQEGSIKVSFRNHLRPELIMKPGDLLIINPAAEEKIITSSTNPQNHFAWTKKRLILHNPTLQEIINYLEDTYGKKFILKDTELANKRVEGPILLDSFDDALFVISTVLNVSITTEGDTLSVRPK